MNRQPYAVPPRWWPSRLHPGFVRWWSWKRNRELRQQGIVSIDAEGGEHVRDAISAGQGVLIVSNHSFHYDSYVLIEAALRTGWLPHFLTAWQVFALTGPWGKWLLQRHGCFSINREGVDAQALKQAQQILTAGRHPLVIFPEGDIYHSNDRVMPFREGAAATALVARKKSPRPIVVIPCAMKCVYLTDPSPELAAMMSRLEQHLSWRPALERPLVERIYRVGNGYLSLKEIEYLGAARAGSVRDRLRQLADDVLESVRTRRGWSIKGGDTTERIRQLRSKVIYEMERLRPAGSPRKLPPDIQQRMQSLHEDLEDLFFVTQLSSYHGDYSASRPTVERMAETIDKFEEDIFTLQSPTPRGQRRAIARFGSPLLLDGETWTTATLTRRLELEVQGLLDEIDGAVDRLNSPIGAFIARAEAAEG